MRCKQDRVRMPKVNNKRVRCMHLPSNTSEALTCETGMGEGEGWGAAWAVDEGLAGALVRLVEDDGDDVAAVADAAAAAAAAAAADDDDADDEDESAILEPPLTRAVELNADPPLRSTCTHAYNSNTGLHPARRNKYKQCVSGTPSHVKRARKTAHKSQEDETRTA
jgi:hypothetical protein